MFTGRSARSILALVERKAVKQLFTTGTPYSVAFVHFELKHSLNAFTKIEFFVQRAGDPAKL